MGLELTTSRSRAARMLYGLSQPGAPTENFLSSKSAFKVLFIYSTERERVQAGGAVEGEGEAGLPPSREPHAGLNPRTPGSRPELKADTQLTEPPRCPEINYI